MRPVLWFENGAWNCASYRKQYGDLTPLDWTSGETMQIAYQHYCDRIDSRHALCAKWRAVCGG